MRGSTVVSRKSQLLCCCISLVILFYCRPSLACLQTLRRLFVTPSLLFPSMAVEFPLVLYDCEFENIQWIYDREVQEFNVTHLQQLWASHAVKTQVLHNMLQGLDAAPVAAGKGKKMAEII